jgi:hypothetical protein
VFVGPQPVFLFGVELIDEFAEEAVVVRDVAV